MRHLISATVILALATPAIIASMAHGQEVGPPAPPPRPKLTNPADPKAAQAAATRLISEMKAAYRSAPAMIDKIRIQSFIQGQPQSASETVMRFGPGSDVEIVTGTSRSVCTSGMMYFTYDHIPERYIKAMMIDDVLTTLTDVFGAYGGVMANCALRYEKPDDEIVQSLVFGMPPPGTARISTYRVVTSEDGRELEQLSLINSAGSATVNVDPVTKLMVSADIEFEVPDAPIPNFTVTRHIEFETQILKELPEPISFDPAGRRPVANLAQLQGKANAANVRDITLKPGDVAGDFTLFTLRGVRMRLTDLRGSVVLLTFWSEVDVSSRQGLPFLEEVIAWAKAEGHPVQVLGINGMRRTTSKAVNWTQADKYWNDRGLSFESLIDPEDEVFEAYGVFAVPMTIVLDPEGRYVTAVAGLDESTPRALQRAIATAIGDPKTGSRPSGDAD